MVKWYQELQEYLQETKEYQVEHFLQEFNLNINNALTIHIVLYTPMFLLYYILSILNMLC